MKVTIAQALPILAREPEFVEALNQRGFVPTQPIEVLLKLQDDAPKSLSFIGEFLLARHRDVSLGMVMPGLAVDADQSVPFSTLRLPVARALHQRGVETWKDLASLTAEDLGRLDGVGRSTTSEIVLICLRRAGPLPMEKSAERECAETAGDSFETDELADDPLGEACDLRLPELGVLARWAQAITTAETVGEALDLTIERELPKDVGASVEELRSIRLEHLTGASGGSAFAHSVSELLRRIGDDRYLTILEQRLALEPPTLEQVASKLSVTRERVRQLQATAEKRAKEAAATPELAEVSWRAEELRRALGVSIPFESADTQAALASATRDLTNQQRPLARAILLWLAGPYRLKRSTGWLHTDPQSEAGPPCDVSFIQEFADEDQRLDVVALDSSLEGLGFVAAAREEWMANEPRIRRVRDDHFLWIGSVADKAAIALKVLAAPATADEINEMIAEGHNVRGLRNRLTDDDRFMRTDLTRIGLREWGLEEYTGIVDEIEQEIELRGGEGDIAGVVATVAERFAVRTASVEAYTEAPRFVCENGKIRVRKPDEPFLPHRTVVDEAACYVLDGSTCNFRVLVDHDLLRGSGRAIPQGLGVWLGVLPGSKRQFQYESDETVPVTWPESSITGPALGSVRRLALSVDAQLDDQLIITFDRAQDELGVQLLTASVLADATGLDRLTLMTGIEASGPDDFENRLAFAIGATGLNELRPRLRARGEASFCHWLRPVDDPELEEALSRLKAVL